MPEFEKTRWSLISRARSDEPDSRAALEALCQDYWRPVYAFVRRWGHGASDAEDVTQDFFCDFVSRKKFEGAREDRGRFRSYLLRSVKHHLLDDAKARKAAKRGGKVAILSLDVEGFEREWSGTLPLSNPAEAVFDRQWAMAVVGKVMEDIHREYKGAKKEKLFAALCPAVHGMPGGDFYETVADRLAMTVNAVRLAVHRLRSRYRDRLFVEVAELMDQPTESEVRAEIDYLFQAFSTETA